MTTESSTHFIMVPIERFQALEKTQEIILRKIDNLLGSEKDDPDFLTAKQFMAKTHMCRTTFDELRNSNRINVLKKGRKIFVPATELKRYFEGK